MQRKLQAKKETDKPRRRNIGKGFGKSTKKQKGKLESRKRGNEPKSNCRQKL